MGKQVPNCQIIFIRTAWWTASISSGTIVSTIRINNLSKLGPPMRSSIALVYVSHSLADIGRIAAASSLILHLSSRSNSSCLGCATYCSPNKCPSTGNPRDVWRSAVAGVAKAVPIRDRAAILHNTPRPTATKPSHRIDLAGLWYFNGTMRTLRAAESGRRG